MDDLRRRCVRSRLASLEMACAAGSGHIAPDFSCMEILTALFFRVLRVDPQNPRLESRDRFILSKGHAVGALYVTLAAAGFFPEAWLQTYQQYDSKLPGHPDRHRTPGVEHNSGALGHGLPVAVGLAAALRLLQPNPNTPRVFVLLGDGELQEGSNWEAAMLAAQLKLSGLIAIVDRNGLQQGAFTEQTVALGDLAAKWASFGWHVDVVDGHDLTALIDVLEAPPDAAGRPHAVIARTVKGKGAPFMENRPGWHHRVPDAAERAQARAALEAELAVLGGADHA